MAELDLIVHPQSPGANAEGGLRTAIGTPDGSLFVADWLLSQTLQGRHYTASDADQNDYVTGQTSFANTTPTFLLNVPDGQYAIPTEIVLGQAGTVGAAQITVVVEIDDIAAFSSGGTSETVFNRRTDNPRTNGCTLYSGATATAGYGVRVWGTQLGPDVSPAEGAVNVVHLSLAAGTLPPCFLVGPASLKVFTYATTTGPTWAWSFSWVEPTSQYVGS